MMHESTIITISRQFGSGGKEIAEQLAKELQIPFYDRELITLAAKESGIHEDLFAQEDYPPVRGHHRLGMIGFSLGSPITSLSEIAFNDRLFAAQTEMIEKLADQGPCVIVGRCADAVLEKRTNLLTVFIHAKLSVRKARAVHTYGMEEHNIESTIRKMDRQRADYYQYYTDRQWGEATYYDLTLDSGAYGIAGCVNLIKAAIGEQAKKRADEQDTIQ